MKDGSKPNKIKSLRNIQRNIREMRNDNLLNNVIQTTLFQEVSK